MIIYNFYVDKNANNKNEKTLQLKPLYPIELKDDQYATIKLCDFSYLNNQYNISQNLKNNTLILKQTDYSYDITIGTNTSYTPLAVEFFESTSGNEDDLLTGVTSTFASNLYTITRATNPNYKLYYASTNSSYTIPNFLDDVKDVNDASKSLDFNEDDNEIIVETIDITNCPIVKTITFDIHKHNTNAVISGMTFEMQVFGSNDNITYTRLPATTLATSYIDFTLGSTTKEIITNTFDITNNNPYKYYKFKLNNIYYDFGDTDYPNYQVVMADFKLARLLLNEIEYTTSTTPTIGATTDTNLTLTDGFYNSTTLINRLNTLFQPYNVVITIDTYTNKLIFTNTQNYTINSIFSNSNGKLQLQFLNKNIKDNYGSDADIVELVAGQNILSKNINLTNFAKLIIASSLNHQEKTHNELIGGNEYASGIGNILAWIANDHIPFSYINYVNTEELEYRIDNKSINNIVMSFYNEKTQQLSLDNALLHLQIKIYTLNK